MNKAIQMQSGELFLVLESLTVNDVRHSIGLLSNKNNFNVTITKLSPGTKRMEIFYYQQESFAFRSMFTIAPQVNLTFLGTSQISYVEGSNLVYVNQEQNVTVQIQTDVALTEDKKASVKCKVGSTYVSTYYTTNDKFICTLFSTTTSLDDLSLYYNSSDALKSEILISSNTLDVLYIGKFKNCLLLVFRKNFNS